MVFIWVRPGMPMLAKDFEGKTPQDFAEAIRDMLGGAVVLCRPFRVAPDLCLVLRENHTRLGLPANRLLEKNDGSAARIIFGGFVLFAMSKDYIVRDLSASEKSLLAAHFMNYTQPDIIPLLNAIPTPEADRRAAMINDPIIKTGDWKAGMRKQLFSMPLPSAS